MKFLLFVLGMLPSIAFAQDMKVLKVIDGDTIVITAPFLPDPLHKHLYLRINGVDTPEKGGRAQCKAENDKSLQAMYFTQQEISSAKNIKIELTKWDKYGGRVLGDLVLDGKPLSAKLLQAGYAREYRGEKKKSWCRL